MEGREEANIANSVQNGVDHHVLYKSCEKREEEKKRSE